MVAKKEMDLARKRSHLRAKKLKKDREWEFEDCRVLCTWTLDRGVNTGESVLEKCLFLFIFLRLAVFRWILAKSPFPPCHGGMHDKKILISVEHHATEFWPVIAAFVSGRGLAFLEIAIFRFHGLTWTGDSCLFAQCLGDFMFHFFVKTRFLRIPPF